MIPPIKEEEVAPFQKGLESRIVANLAALRLSDFPTDQVVGVRIG